MPSAQQFVAPKWFSSLKQIVIGNGYCEDDRIVEIDGLGELESIVVGEGSFTYARTRSAVRKSKRADGTLRIVKVVVTSCCNGTKVLSGLYISSGLLNAHRGNY